LFTPPEFASSTAAAVPPATIRCTWYSMQIGPESIPTCRFNGGVNTIAWRCMRVA